jgi:hypothetical protein
LAVRARYLPAAARGTSQRLTVLAFARRRSRGAFGSHVTRSVGGVNQLADWPLFNGQLP